MSKVKFNSKRTYVRALFHAIRANGTENPKITFLTNFGFIEGTKANIKKYDIEKEEVFTEQLKLAHKEDGVFKFRDVALSMVNALVEKNEESLEESNEMIHLEDVKIVHNNNTIHMEEFTLFLDQVIGVIPGTISVN